MVRDSAYLASASYLMGKNKSKNKRIAKVEKYFDKNGVNGYKIDRKYSNSEHLAVRDQNTGELVVAYHGTDVKGKRGASDLYNDAAIAFGKYKKTDRFKRADKFAKKLKRQGEEVSYVGHSLGGALAARSARVGDTEYDAYNPLITLNNKKDYKRAPGTIYRTQGDFASILGSGKNIKKKTQTTKHYNPFTAHSMSNFTTVNYQYMG